MKPYLSQSEINAMEDLLSSKKGDLFEWGSGGSTIHFAKFCNNLYSVEHKDSWYNSVNSIKPNNVKYFLVPSDKPQAKKDDGTIEEFHTYVNFIKKFKNKTFDYVFIDGRARPYCANACLDFISDESFVMIHDWPKEDDEVQRKIDPHRIAYKSVLDYLTLIKVVDKLAFLKKS